jgi:hypothetical protein
VTTTRALWICGTVEDTISEAVQAFTNDVNDSQRQRETIRQLLEPQLDTLRHPGGRRYQYSGFVVFEYEESAT